MDVNALHGGIGGHFMADRAGEGTLNSFEGSLIYAYRMNISRKFSLRIGAQATVVQSYTNSSAAAYTTHTATFTAPTSGIYYFGIHNNTPQASIETFLFLDSISLTTNLSTISNLISNINIYPNPTENFLNISNPNNVEIKSISVVDINGRIVKNQSNSLSQINVSDLNAGVYFVTIEAAEGKTTKKFIKQ